MTLSRSSPAPLAEEATGPTLTVTDSDTFEAALDSLAATGGTILVDSAGGPISLFARNVAAAAGIRITSADPDTPAEIAWMKLVRCDNITIDGLAFEIDDPKVGNGLYLQGCDTVTVRDNRFTGTADGKFGPETSEAAQGGAIYVRSSTGVTIEDNAIAATFSGIGIANGTDTVLRGNSLTQLQGDCFRVISSIDTLVEGNHISDLYGSSNDLNHPDMLQYYDNGADRPVQNLTIVDNYFNAGDTSYQGIYGGIRDLTGRHENIHVENNLIVTGSRTGIKITNFDGIEILNNTLIYNADSVSHGTAEQTTPTSDVPLISLQDSADARVIDNVADVLMRDEDNTTVTGYRIFDGNVTPSYVDARSDLYAGRVFANVGHGGPKDLRDFQMMDAAVASGAIAAGKGAAMTWLDLSDLLAMHVTLDRYAPQSFDLSVLDPVADSFYIWFVDGLPVAGGTESQVKGLAAGTHQISLTAYHADGSTETLERRIEVPDATLYSFDPAAGYPELGPMGPQQVYQISGDPELTTSADGSGRAVLDLAPGDAFEVTRGHPVYDQLYRFSMLLEFRQDDPGTGGYLLGKRSGLKVEAHADGSVSVWMRTVTGEEAEITSAAGLVNDTGWHSLSLSYDSEGAGLAARVDDVAIGQDAATGAMDDGNRAISVGQLSRNAPGIDGEIGLFLITDQVSDTDAEIRDPLALIDRPAREAPPPEHFVDGFEFVKLPMAATEAEDGAEDGSALSSKARAVLPLHDAEAGGTGEMAGDLSGGLAVIDDDPFLI